MGSSSHGISSRFLKDIPPHLVNSVGLTGQFEKAADTIPRLATLKAGDRVRHAKFGEGLVVGLLATKDDYEVTVAFEEAGIKKLLLSLAPLERIT
jgi:DNA helicase-2/ATP-dependent DNA helicase PcrA